jgi:hypothetical protein
MIRVTRIALLTWPSSPRIAKPVPALTVLVGYKTVSPLWAEKKSTPLNNQQHPNLPRLSEAAVYSLSKEQPRNNHA